MTSRARKVANARGLSLAISLAAIAIPAESNMCTGPGLHNLRLVDAQTVEVQGDGGTARTRDGGKTWQSIAKPKGVTGDAFDHRAFKGPQGHLLQNLEVAGNVVIEKPPGRLAWRERWPGLLLEVRGNTAFVYAGALSRPSWSDKGWLLDGGDIGEYAINGRVNDLAGNSPRLKVEFRPGSVRVCTPDSWLSTPCGPALAGPPDAPFLLTGFAVEPSRPRPGDSAPSPRDVYLATADKILHWQGASERWAQIPAPPDWLRCSGPVPQPPWPPGRSG